MNRKQDRKWTACQRAEPDGSHQDTYNLTKVGGEQELDGFADIIINPPALLHSGDNGGKIIICQHHIGHVFRHVRACDAHADSNIGCFNRRGIVHAVARHCCDHAAFFPCADDAHLMLRLHTGINGILIHLALKRLVIHLAELCAGDGPAGILNDAELLCNCHGRIAVVARNHNRPDTRLATFRHGSLHLRPNRIDHAGQADKNKLLLQLLRLKGIRQAAIGTVGRCQHAQGFIRHRFILLQDFFALLLRQRDCLAAFPYLCAAAEHHIGSALGILNILPLLRLMDSGHHLPHGVKRRFSHARKSFFQFLFVER